MSNEWKGEGQSSSGGGGGEREREEEKEGKSKLTKGPRWISSPSIRPVLAEATTAQGPPQQRERPLSPFRRRRTRREASLRKVLLRRRPSCSPQVDFYVGRLERASPVERRGKQKEYQLPYHISRRIVRNSASPRADGLSSSCKEREEGEGRTNEEGCL